MLFISGAITWYFAGAREAQEPIIVRTMLKRPRISRRPHKRGGLPVTLFYQGNSQRNI